MNKICSKCNVGKDLNLFNKNKQGKFGRRSTCKQCDRTRQKTYFKSLTKDQKEKKLRAYRTYYYNNLKKERARKELYRKENLHKDAEYQASRRSRIKKASFDFCKNEVQEIYKNRPKGYHVDHIVPLKGKNVSGLHVPWNLQYLPSKENISKGNRWL